MRKQSTKSKPLLLALKNGCEVNRSKEMASGSSFSSMLLFGNSNEEDQVNQATNIQQDIHVVPQTQPQTVQHKKRRNPPGVPYPDAEIIALSPTTLMAKNRFICEVCYKGFPRDQNLQLHKRGHNLPWKLKQKSITDEVKRKVYLCPEPSCLNHEPSHALGDLTGIKKHYSRKHGEKKYKCQKCAKLYAVQSDLKAHSKTCGTKEYQCHCGILFSRRDSFINHRAFCNALPQGIRTISPMEVTSFKTSDNHNHLSHMNINSPQLGSQFPSTQDNTNNFSKITPGVSQLNRPSYNSFMIRTTMDLNYHKPPPSLLVPSSNQQNQHKYHEDCDTKTFTNLVNNTTTKHNTMQLFNLSFMGHPINSGSGEGLSLFSGGNIVSHQSASLYVSSHTSDVPEVSATGMLQKATILGSTSSTNTVTNIARGYASSSSSGAICGSKSEKGKFIFSSSHFSGTNGYHNNMNKLLNSFSRSGVGSSIFNHYTTVTNEHEENYQGGLSSGNAGNDDEWKNCNSIEQQSPENSSFNDFQQFNHVRTTRDFLGVGVEMISNINSDGPKSTFTGRSFL